VSLAVARAELALLALDALAAAWRISHLLPKG
jgi:hypothetical protein